MDSFGIIRNEEDIGHPECFHEISGISGHFVENIVLEKVFIAGLLIELEKVSGHLPLEFLAVFVDQRSKRDFVITPSGFYREIFFFDSGVFSGNGISYSIDHCKLNGCIEREIFRIILFFCSREDILSEIRIAEAGLEGFYPDFLSRKRLEFKKVFPFSVRGGHSGISEYPDGRIFHRKSFIGENGSGDTERYEVFIACIRESGAEVVPFFFGFLVFSFQGEKVDIVLKDSCGYSGIGSYPICNILSDEGIFPFFDYRHAWLYEIVELEKFGFFGVFYGACIDDGAFLESGFVFPDIFYILRMLLKIIRDETVDIGLSWSFRWHFETYLFGSIDIRELREALDKAF